MRILLLILCVAVSIVAQQQTITLTKEVPGGIGIQQVATPTFSPVAGTYSGTQSVTIDTTTTGDTICYTDDGSTPAASTPGTCSAGTTYSAPVSVASSSTLKAIGTKVGMMNSAVGSAAYTITPAVYTITRVQQIGPSTNCASPCNITVSGTGAGNLGVVLLYNYGYEAIQVDSVSGGGTWTAAGACKSRSSPAPASSSDIAYNLNLTGGVTTIAVTPNYVGNSTTYALYVEYSKSGGSWALDGACRVLNDQAASATPTSPSVITAGASDVIVTILATEAIHFGSTTVTGTGWTTPLTMFFPGPTFATAQTAGTDALNLAAGTYQATFDGYSGTFPFGASALAVKVE